MTSRIGEAATNPLSGIGKVGGCLLSGVVAASLHEKMVSREYRQRWLASLAESAAFGRVKAVGSAGLIRGRLSDSEDGSVGRNP